MDMDYIRELLLMIESGRLPDGSASEPGENTEVRMDQDQAKKLTHYLNILGKNELIAISKKGDSEYFIDGLTPKGRDFLEEIR